MDFINLNIKTVILFGRIIIFKIHIFDRFPRFAIILKEKHSKKIKKNIYLE